MSNRKFRDFLLICIFLIGSTSNASMQCSILFSLHNSKFERFLFDHDSLSDAGDNYEKKISEAFKSIYRIPIENAASRYAFDLQYPGKYTNKRITYFRGMALKSPDELIKILNEGFQSSSTKFKTTYFDDSPVGAISYSLNPNNGPTESGVHLHVLFELDSGLMPPLRPTRVGFTTPRHVPSTAITKIHIFDKQASSEFPITTLTPEQFIEFYLNP